MSATLVLDATAALAYARQSLAVGELPGVEVTPLDPELALGMGVLVGRGGGVGLAHAATEALAHDAQVATRSARAVAAVLPPGWDIIDIDQG